MKRSMLLSAAGLVLAGDNDWTDCDRPSNGGFNSLERLDHERQVFFSTPFSLGQKRILQEVQTAPLCLGVSGPVPCVENRRWSHRGVTYVTLNIQGSCNNLCDTAPNPAEFAARNQANIAWMREAFRDAQGRGSAAIMIGAQANPGWDLADPTRAPLRNPRTLAETDGQPDGFQEFLIALRDEEFLEAVGLAIGLGERPRIAQRSSRRIGQIPARIGLRADHDRGGAAALSVAEGFPHPRDVGLVARGEFRRIGRGVAQVVARALDVQRDVGDSAVAPAPVLDAGHGAAHPQAQRRRLHFLENALLSQ